MSLVNMERPKPSDVKSEAKLSEPIATDSYYEKYPYGLRLTLRADEIKKLGLDVSKIKAGSNGSLSANIKFIEVESRESLDSSGATKDDSSLDIQITDLEVITDNSFKDEFNKITGANNA
jgi:hypothetical protein